MKLALFKGRVAQRAVLARDLPVEPSRVDKLLASGIFDAEFYAAAAGSEFPTERAAARHCVRRGMAGSISPSPLLDISSVPRRVQLAWRAGRIGVLLAHLRKPTSQSTIGPLFAWAECPGTEEEKASHPGGALGHFLDTATDQSPLPVPVGYPTSPPTLGQARRALVDHVSTTEQQRRRCGPRVSAQWNEAAEVAWKEQWRGWVPPASRGPLVSVVMPVRNRPDLVARAIGSLQQQTVADWELLVVDDGSDDDTPEVVATLATHDRRIRLHRQLHRGVSAARNLGLRAAQGRFVAFLDSDNTWRPDFLDVGLPAVLHGGHHAAYAAARLVDRSSGAVTYRAYEGGLDALLVKNHVDLNTFLVDRQLALTVGGFDETLRRWVDHDFAIRVAKRTHLEFLPFVACDYDDDRRAVDRITTTEPEAWQYVVLGKHWVDWDRLRAEVQHRQHSLVSVVIPTYQDWRMTLRAASAVLADADADGLEVEVVIVDNGSVREVGTQLVASYLTEARLRYVRLPRNLNFAIGCNVGFATSSGRHVVFLNNDTVVRRGWLSGLLPHLSDEEVRGVQPLLLYPDDTIQSAGTVFAAQDFLPTHFLVGHPPEDAVRSSRRSFSAVTAAALAVRAEEFAELSGFDTIFVNGMEDIDYCLRAIRHYHGWFVVEPDARVTHLESKTPGRGAMIGPNRLEFMRRWRGALPSPDASDRYQDVGLTVAHLTSDGNAVPAARPLVVRQRPHMSESLPRLRWGVKVAAIPGADGDAWGDTHLANSLAKALRRVGQEVVTYRHGAHTSSASHLDDVVLGIRGLDVVVPLPGKLNILWVISHPDDVSPDELVGFDLVFAASASWSLEMSRRSGRPVHLLHQAVDVENLPPISVARHREDRPVFVGANHNGRHRQAVYDAALADVGLVIHGPGWEGTPFAERVASEYVPNSQLPTLYREHGLVLADHWPDMAANGFIANRVFDAVAAGARVVSDDVTGVEETFGGAVRVYQSIEDLRHLCSPDGRDRFPSDADLSAIARRVAREHSFDQRADALLTAVLSRLRHETGRSSVLSRRG